MGVERGGVWGGGGGGGGGRLYYRGSICIPQTT